jgi:hypothetical protein
MTASPVSIRALLGTLAEICGCVGSVGVPTKATGHIIQIAYGVGTSTLSMFIASRLGRTPPVVIVAVLTTLQKKVSKPICKDTKMKLLI